MQNSASLHTEWAYIWMTCFLRMSSNFKAVCSLSIHTVKRDWFIQHYCSHNSLGSVRGMRIPALQARVANLEMVCIFRKRTVLVADKCSCCQLTVCKMTISSTIRLTGMAQHPMFAHCSSMQHLIASQLYSCLWQFQSIACCCSRLITS